MFIGFRPLIPTTRTPLPIAISWTKPLLLAGCWMVAGLELIHYLMVSVTLSVATLKPTICVRKFVQTLAISPTIGLPLSLISADEGFGLHNLTDPKYGH